MPASAPAELSCPPCRFGSFELLPDERRLLADGEPVTLGARAFDLLVALVARAGQLVSKNDLLTLVWPGVVVEENNLQVQVSRLRKLLGPSALATIPGRGYRFALPVERADKSIVGDPPPTPPEQGGIRTDIGDHRSHVITGTRAYQPSFAPVAAVRSRRGRRSHQGIARPPRRPDYRRRRRHRQDAGRADRRRAARRRGAADYPDGVWWVELASLSDGCAGAVGGRAGTGYDARRRPATGRYHRRGARAAARAAGARQLRASVPTPSPTFVDTLCAAAPGLRVLVTSQETLKTSDEHVYRLARSKCPSPTPKCALARRRPARWNCSWRGRRRSTRISR